MTLASVSTHSGVCVFIYFRQTFAKKRDYGKGGVFLRTETINSIGDTYIREVFFGMGESRCLQQQQERRRRLLH